MIPLKLSRDLKTKIFEDDSATAADASECVSFAQEMRKLAVVQQLQALAIDAVSCCGVQAPMGIIVYNPDMLRFEIVALVQNIAMPDVLGQLPELPHDALVNIFQMPRGNDTP